MKTTFIKIQSEATTLVVSANQLQIKDEQSLTIATEILSQANLLLKEVTLARKAETDSLKQEIKEKEIKYKPTEQALDGIIANLRSQAGRYQTELAKELKAKEDAISARVGDGRGKLKVETAVAQMDNLDRPVEKVAAVSGSMTFRAKNTLKITDIKLIPRDYLVPDEDKLLQAMEAGMTVPGCEIEVIQVPVNRRTY